MNNALVFVCFFTDTINKKLTELAIRSFREKGDYQGDIILFTDYPGDFGVDSYGVTVVKNNEFLKNNTCEQGRRFSDRFRRYFFRLFMYDFFDFSPYSKVIYVDYDVLAERPIQPMFDYISEDSFYFTYAARKKWIRRNDSKNKKSYNPFFAEWFDTTMYQKSIFFVESKTGVCSGIFGAKKDALRTILKTWREYIGGYHRHGIDLNGQMGLNHLLVMGKIDGRAFPDKWIGYPFSPVLNNAQKKRIPDYEQSVFRHGDKRDLDDRSGVILNHFNPGDGLTKLGYMLQQLQHGKIVIPGVNEG